MDFDSVEDVVDYDEWAVQRARYMTLESMGQLSDDPLISLPAVAR